jgi:hypothetical protein
LLRALQGPAVVEAQSRRFVMNTATYLVMWLTAHKAALVAPLRASSIQDVDNDKLKASMPHDYDSKHVGDTEKGESLRFGGVNDLTCTAGDLGSWSRGWQRQRSKSLEMSRAKAHDGGDTNGRGARRDVIDNDGVGADLGVSPTVTPPRIFAPAPTSTCPPRRGAPGFRPMPIVTCWNSRQLGPTMASGWMRQCVLP